MEKITRMTSELRDDLVAYLDGELDEPATQRVEQILARSEVARHEVEVLSRTYDLLGTLPACRASQEFTQRTIASLQAIPYRPSLTEQPWYIPARRGFVAFVWLATAALSLFLGFQITRNLVPSETDRLIQELPLIQKLDDYDEILVDSQFAQSGGELEFLRKLQQQGVFKHAESP